MSVAEFLIWDSGDRSGRPWQLIDGVPQAMSPTALPHGAILAELGRLLGNHLAAGERECRVIVEPGVVPRVRASSNVRIPDLAVVCGLASTEHLLADPMLLIEILSPSNAHETYANVWTYTTIPSVQEILIISSTRRRGEILRRQPDGNWPEIFDTIDAGTVCRLDSIGFSFDLNTIYRTSGIQA